MSNFELIIISLSLAMDAVAIAFVCSACSTAARKRSLVKAAFLFAIFQGMMPLFGYALGLSVHGIIVAYDHWIGFILLVIVGGKMILDKEDRVELNRLYSNHKLLFLAVATSLDALVVGLTFSFREIHLLASVSTIALITLVLTLAAGFAGRKFCHMNQRLFTEFGGVAIILVGFKILLNNWI